VPSRPWGWSPAPTGDLQRNQSGPADPLDFRDPDRLMMLEQMRRFARRHALEFMDQQQPSALTDAQASQLAADAKRWARSSSKSRRKTK
jgi:hypothetical protein